MAATDRPQCSRCETQHETAVPSQQGPVAIIAVWALRVVLVALVGLAFAPIVLGMAVPLWIGIVNTAALAVFPLLTVVGVLTIDHRSNLLWHVRREWGRAPIFVLLGTMLPGLAVVLALPGTVGLRFQFYDCPALRETIQEILSAAPSPAVAPPGTSRR